MRWVYWGEGLKWQEPNPKELFNLGIKSYKEQDFSQAKEYFKKRLDAIMLKIMLEWVNFCKGMDLRINLKILPSLSKKPSGRAVKTLLKGMEFVFIVWLLIVNILIFVLMLVDKN
ncbi:hypothetical protein BTM448_05360 [Helicobacter pylori]